jgi:hypothetical protein
MLGVGNDLFSLWCVASRKFEDEFISGCPWKLDLQQYAGEINTPKIHKYLLEGSALFFDKNHNK